MNDDNVIKGHEKGIWNDKRGQCITGMICVSIIMTILFLGNKVFQNGTEFNYFSFHIPIVRETDMSFWRLKLSVICLFGD